MTEQQAALVAVNSSQRQGTIIEEMSIDEGDRTKHHVHRRALGTTRPVK